MNKRIITAIAAGLLVMPVGFGCRGGGGSDGEVPENVQIIEENAEDAIDLILAGNWSNVPSDAEAIADAWSDFLESSEADDVTDDQKTAMATALENLTDGIAANDGLAARQGANDVSKVIIDVMDQFDPDIPADVGRLDYLERQVILDAERGDWTVVLEDIETIQATFDKVRGSVEDAGGDSEAGDFAASIENQLQFAQMESTDIIGEANLALELVDDLESVF